MLLNLANKLRIMLFFIILWVFNWLCFLSYLDRSCLLYVKLA